MAAYRVQKLEIAKILPISMRLLRKNIEMLEQNGIVCLDQMKTVNKNIKVNKPRGRRMYEQWTYISYLCWPGLHKNPQNDKSIKDIISWRLTRSSVNSVTQLELMPVRTSTRSDETSKIRYYRVLCGLSYASRTPRTTYQRGL